MKNCRGLVITMSRVIEAMRDSLLVGLRSRPSFLVNHDDN